MPGCGHLISGCWPLRHVLTWQRYLKMSKLNESAIEDLAVKYFKRLGYSHIHAPDIAPDGNHPERIRKVEATAAFTA